MKKPMRTVNEAEVKQNLDALLDEVARGAQIAITRRGKEVARGNLSINRGRKTSSAKTGIADRS